MGPNLQRNDPKYKTASQIHPVHFFSPNRPFIPFNQDPIIHSLFAYPDLSRQLNHPDVPRFNLSNLDTLEISRPLVTSSGAPKPRPHITEQEKERVYKEDVAREDLWDRIGDKLPHRGPCCNNKELTSNKIPPEPAPSLTKQQNPKSLPTPILPLPNQQSPESQPITVKQINQTPLITHLASEPKSLNYFVQEPPLVKEDTGLANPFSNPEPDPIRSGGSSSSVSKTFQAKTYQKKQRSICRVNNPEVDDQDVENITMQRCLELSLSDNLSNKLAIGKRKQCENGESSSSKWARQTTITEKWYDVNTGCLFATSSSEEELLEFYQAEEAGLAMPPKAP